MGVTVYYQQIAVVLEKLNTVLISHMVLFLHVPVSYYSASPSLREQTARC